MLISVTFPPIPVISVTHTFPVLIFLSQWLALPPFPRTIRTTLGAVLFGSSTSRWTHEGFATDAFAFLLCEAVSFFHTRDVPAFLIKFTKIKDYPGHIRRIL